MRPAAGFPEEAGAVAFVITSYSIHYTKLYEKGISKIVSMRLKEIGVKELAVNAVEPAPTIEIEEDKPKRARRKKAAAEPPPDEALPVGPASDED